MDQWIADEFDHGLVQFGILPTDQKLNVFLQIAGDVANQARKSAKDRLDRDHAGPEACILQFVCNEAEPRAGLSERRIEIGRDQLASAPVAAKLNQAIPFEHQFADEVDQFVEF